jgi:hypothetical protein
MEYWNDGIMGRKRNDKNPIFQYSIIPIFQLFAVSMIPI